MASSRSVAEDLTRRRVDSFGGTWSDPLRCLCDFINAGIILSRLRDPLCSGHMTELQKTSPAALALDSRSGWPTDLRLLIDRYPREVWQSHANLGAMAQFWLSRHDMFREIGAALEDATGAFRD